MVKLLMLTGSLEWDQPERATHCAGSVLTITFRLSNPTASARSYQIFLTLFEIGNGSVISGSTGPISAGGMDTFEVDAENEITVVAPLKIDYSNVLLQAALYDVELGEMATGLQSILELPPGLGEQITPVLSFAGGVMCWDLSPEWSRT